MTSGECPSSGVVLACGDPCWYTVASITGLLRQPEIPLRVVFHSARSGRGCPASGTRVSRVRWWRRSLGVKRSSAIDLARRGTIAVTRYRSRAFTSGT